MIVLMIGIGMCYAILIIASLLLIFGDDLFEK